MLFHLSFPNFPLLFSPFPFLPSLHGRATPMTLKAPTDRLVPSFSPRPFAAPLLRAALWTTLGMLYNTKGAINSTFGPGIKVDTGLASD